MSNPNRDLQASKPTTRKILTNLVINGYDDGLVGDDCAYVFNEPARSLYKQAYALGNKMRLHHADPPTDMSADARDDCVSEERL